MRGSTGRDDKGIGKATGFFFVGKGGLWEA